MSNTNYYTRLSHIIKKPFLSFDDISELMNRGITTTSRIMNEFIREYEKKNPDKAKINRRTGVPTKAFLEYYSYDVNSINDMAKLEQEGVL